MKPEKKIKKTTRTPKAARAQGASAEIAPSAEAPKAAGGGAAKVKRAPRAGGSARKPVASGGAGVSRKGGRKVQVPAILLEGDRSAGPEVGGPGQRYALGPTAPVQQLAGVAEAGELPEAYGTQRLRLTARDPQWVYAHWDFTREQLRKYNALSSDRHLVVRVYAGSLEGERAAEAHVHPESRNWFIHVGRGGTRYVAELGYYAAADGKWVRLAVSSPTLTPPDTLAEDLSVEFATIPIDMPFEQLVSLVRAAVQENVPLAEAILQLRAAGHRELPGARQIAAEKWTPAQERALAELVSVDQVRRVWIGSLEVTELIRRQLAQQLSSAGVSQFSVPGGVSSVEVSSLSSPFGGMPGRRGFWFNVNAELIIYGATEPDARVTIGGRPIQLRPDGTFSYRFALPDGRYALPAEATSADGVETRRAGLEFSRQTAYAGEVGAHPQDPALKPPRPEHVA